MESSAVRTLFVKATLELVSVLSTPEPLQTDAKYKKRVSGGTKLKEYIRNGKLNCSALDVILFRPEIRKASPGDLCDFNASSSQPFFNLDLFR